MEWIEGQMFTEKTGLPVRFSAPTSCDGYTYRMVRVGMGLLYPVYDSSGQTANCIDVLKAYENVVHRPPVPAPAPQKCEHSWACSWEPIWRCSKCKKETLSNPFPSVPAPQPDSVEIARRIANSSGVIDASDFRELCNSYVTEQTRQRKAAGELAKAAQNYLKMKSMDAVSGDNWLRLLTALAADAETRAGKY